MNIAKTVYTGDTGAALNAVMVTSAGTPLDLTNASSVELILQSPLGALSGGNATIDDDPTTGKVSYVFTDEDTVNAGDYEATFKVHTTDGDFIYPTSGPFLIRVQSVNDPTILVTPIVTASEAFTFTGERVTLGDLWKAQNYVSIFLGLDVSDTTDMAYVKDRDLKRVKQAIALWAVDIHKQGSPSNLVTLSVPPGIKSFSQADVSITFTNSSETEISVVPPSLVQVVLSKLSWRNSKTIKVKSMFDNDNPRVWTTNTAFYNPVVRGLPSEDQLWY